MVISGKRFITSVRETTHTLVVCTPVWYEGRGDVSTFCSGSAGQAGQEFKKPTIHPKGGRGNVGFLVSCLLGWGWVLPKCV